MPFNNACSVGYTLYQCASTGKKLATPTLRQFSFGGVSRWRILVLGILALFPVVKCQFANCGLTGEIRQNNSFYLG